MNYIDFFGQVVQNYNNENKCGFCWCFSAPLSEQKINIQELREGYECCVQVMYTQNEGNAFVLQNNYNTQTNLLQQAYALENFNLYFLIPSRLGVNNYNEIQNHDLQEARYKQLFDLKECITEQLHLNFCEFFKDTYHVTRWEGRQLLDYQDNNYIGYKVYVTIRKRLL